MVGRKDSNPFFAVNPGGPTSLDAKYRRFENYGAAFELVSDLVHEDFGKGLYLVILPLLCGCVDSVRLARDSRASLTSPGEAPTVRAICLKRSTLLLRDWGLIEKLVLA